jgi:hypothetical protein
VLRAQPDDSEAGYRFMIDFGTKVISLGDRHRSYSRMCDFDARRPVEVLVFLQGSVVECFVSEGYCFTMRAYDYSQGTARLGPLAKGIRVNHFSARVCE